MVLTIYHQAAFARGFGFNYFSECSHLEVEPRSATLHRMDGQGVRRVERVI